MQELFTTGKTAEKVSGFVSKAGKPFDAYLKYTDEKIQFDFNNQSGTASENNASPASRPWLSAESESDEYWASLMAGAAEMDTTEETIRSEMDGLPWS